MGGGMNYWLPDLRVLAGTMVLGDGVLFVSNIIDGQLHAIDTAAGKARWTFTDWFPITNPILRGDAVYIGNSAGGLRKLSKTSGELLAAAAPPLSLEPFYAEEYILLTYLREIDSIGFGYPPLFTKESFDHEDQRPFTHMVALHDLRVTVRLPQLLDTSEYYSRAIAKRNIGDSKLRFAVRMIPEPIGTNAVPGVAPDNRVAVSARAEMIQRQSRTFGRAYGPQLLGLLGDPVPEVRRAAVSCLGDLGSHEDADAIATLIKDADAQVGAAAIRALVQVNGAAARSYITPIFNSPTSSLFQTAVACLVSVGDADAIALLKRTRQPDEYLEDDDILVGLC
jgi:hypothetical protein